jgi:hypothetical protein
LGTNTCFNASIIYRDNSLFKREALWFDIVSHSDGWESTSSILMGDFYVIYSLDKKRRGAIWWPLWKNNLNNLIQLGLEDLRFFGSMFTWINQQCNNVLINMKWKCDFAVSRAIFACFWYLESFLDVS